MDRDEFVNSQLQLWDAETSKLVRNLEGHSQKIATLAWNNRHILTSGSHDQSIINHDVRARRNVVSRLCLLLGARLWCIRKSLCTLHKSRNGLFVVYNGIDTTKRYQVVIALVQIQNITNCVCGNMPISIIYDQTWRLEPSYFLQSPPSFSEAKLALSRIEPETLRGAHFKVSSQHHLTNSTGLQKSKN
ncbi:hypothetical protein MTR_1g049000 [Medicago truncatula]|uniref:Uncharacterized protein n=1 Tax=Medicago truncatula TaxID=3880 RepID=A0A072VTB2_MEDTR|nr:hypothetical protein MTR_1g049000 [Medicago truncatula]